MLNDACCASMLTFAPFHISFFSSFLSFPLQGEFSADLRHLNSLLTEGRELNLACVEVCCCSLCYGGRTLVECLE